MPSILAVAPGTPPALQGRRLLGNGLKVEVCADARKLLSGETSRTADVLVLAEMGVDEQQECATLLQQDRRWRLVPILYVLDAAAPGFAIPGNFRPEVDGLARGGLDSLEVQRRMKQLARVARPGAELVVAGPFELDPVRGVLTLPGAEVELTEREAEILAILLARPDSTIAASEIIERSWGLPADERHLQILRRHISNIRRKLQETPAMRTIRTVRGAGYRFDARLAS